ncbi:hypothetical protein [Streptosporangium sp. CA-115845]|uniref:hypothetical protein n=1 Tax=Streptosporangium sp. CA-115845 TaxID=3240071 RepID=UPI003D8B7173
MSDQGSPPVLARIWHVINVAGEAGRLPSGQSVLMGLPLRAFLGRKSRSVFRT